jgi:hypothetical protein
MQPDVCDRNSLQRIELQFADSLSIQGIGLDEPNLWKTKAPARSSRGLRREKLLS